MKRRNLWMSLTLMCGLFTIAFTFDSSGVCWIWKDAVPGAVSLGLASVVFAILWRKASTSSNAGQVPNGN